MDPRTEALRALGRLYQMSPQPVTTRSGLGWRWRQVLYKIRGWYV